jgi:4-aminobutyrate aminotransferase/(S)-3-amino-2-methylpropionate transaminase
MKRFPLVGDVRGLGAMRAFEFVTTRDGRQPAKEETQSIVRYCYEHGLMVLSAGTYGNVIRLLVPLIISDEQLNEGFEVLEEAIASVCNHRLSTAGVP